MSFCGQPLLFISVYWCLLIFVHCLMMVLGLFVMQSACFLSVILFTFQTLFPLLILNMGSHVWMCLAKEAPEGRPQSTSWFSSKT